MIVDLKIAGKYVVVIGGGAESCRKTRDFLEAGAKILVVSKTASSGIQKLKQLGKIALQKENIENAEAYVNSLNPKPDLLVAVTNNHKLNADLSKHAKTAGYMVYTPDNPATSDFTLPALAKIGDVKVAVSTAGRSPAMASILRQRIEKMITHGDLLQVKLQDQLRRSLRQQIADQKTRRKLLYEVLENAEVKKLLKKGEFDKAHEVAMETLKKARSEKSPTATIQHEHKECAK